MGGLEGGGGDFLAPTKPVQQSGFCPGYYSKATHQAGSPPTIHGDGTQNDPGRPLWKVLDEHQGHERADHDEVGLLQHQGALPVDAHHAHRPEVPDGQEQGGVVHGHIVGLEHFPVRPKSSPGAGTLTGDVRP